MTTVFWICLVGSAFSYVIYPLIVRIVVRETGRGSAEPAELPRVSLIIAAFNEEERLRLKLDNSLELDFPAEKLEIIVASDGSTDATDSIAREYSDRGVRLSATGERSGKEHAQLAAIGISNGEIIVFSDVSTTIPEDALRRLMEEFSDPGVGAVSSEDRFQSGGRPAGEGMYVRYEMWLRGLESRAAGLVGMSGSFFAARRDVCEPWDTGSPSDFSVALNCARKGYRAVSSPRVLGYYPDIKDETKEYGRKIRTVLRGMTGLSRNPDVLNPFRYGFFSFQVFGHKLMRWAVPWFLVGLLLSSAWLAPGNPIMFVFLVLQLLFYLLAFLGSRIEFFRKGALLKVPYFFTLVNVATLHASMRFMRGQEQLTWQPSKR